MKIALDVIGLLIVLICVGAVLRAEVGGHGVWHQEKDWRRWDE